MFVFILFNNQIPHDFICYVLCITSCGGYVQLIVDYVVCGSGTPTSCLSSFDWQLWSWACQFEQWSFNQKFNTGKPNIFFLKS